MPKITVNEIDNSRYVSPSESAPMTVLVPGTASFGPVFSAEYPAVSTFVGEDALVDFYNAYGINPALVEGDNKILAAVEGDLSFEYATNLLKSGATIQFYRLNNGSKAKGELITAKHSGRFGNHLIVEFSYIEGAEKDVLVTVYKTPKNAPNTGNVDNKNKIELYTKRISADIESAQYVAAIELDFIDVTVDALNTIITKINADTKYVEYLTGALDFADDSGNAVEDEISTVVASLKESYSNFADPYLFDFDFVTSGGINLSNDGLNEEVHKSMVGLCEARKDCMAIIDTAASDTYKVALEYAQKYDTSYCTFYAPWATIVSSTTGKTVEVPPSLLFMKAILYGMNTQTESELWYVPAGVSRASAPFIVSPAYEIGSTILDEFQNNHKYRINPIMKLRNYGYCVYGNSTGLQSKPGLSASALESMNVRLISNVIKKYIFEVCSGLSFDYNNSTLWLKFYSQMDEKLLYMKRHYGLYDYKIQMDSSTVTRQAQNERRVPGKILISPTLAGEYFDIDFEIAPSGVSFTAEGE